MGQVIERCRTCGFDIPLDAGACPGCARVAAPPLAARQAAGQVLPTRSVHRVRAVRPRTAAPVRPMGRARAARSAFSFTTALALMTFAAAGLRRLVGHPQLVLQVPEGTASFFEDLTTATATASVVAFAIGVVALAVWCLRATGHVLRARFVGRA